MKLSERKILIRMAELLMRKGELARRMGLRASGLSQIFAQIRNGGDVFPDTAGSLAAALEVGVEAILADEPVKRKRGPGAQAQGVK